MYNGHSDRVYHMSNKKLYNTDLSVLQKRIYDAVDKQVAASIEDTVKSLDKFVKEAILQSVGIKIDPWSRACKFEAPNGKKTPAHIVAEEKVAQLLRRDVDRLAQEAYGESIGDIKQAIADYMRKEFKSELRQTVSHLIENEARSMAKELIEDVRVSIKSIVDEIVKPQIAISVEEGSYDLSDPRISDSAAVVQALSAIVEKM